MPERGDALRLGEEIGRVEFREIVEAAQVALAVREQRVAGLGDGAVEADRGHDVLERATLADVHVDVAGGDERDPVSIGESAKRGEFCAVVRAVVELGGEPEPVVEMLLQPDGVLVCVVMNTIPSQPSP